MTFSTLWSWAFENFGVWIIGGIVVWQIAKASVTGDMGKAVWSVVVGACAYWFGKDPKSALDLVSQIADKMKGGA